MEYQMFGSNTLERFENELMRVYYSNSSDIDKQMAELNFRTFCGNDCIPFVLHAIQIGCENMHIYRIRQFCDIYLAVKTLPVEIQMLIYSFYIQGFTYQYTEEIVYGFMKGSPRDTIANRYNQKLFLARCSLERKIHDKIDRNKAQKIVEFIRDPQIPPEIRDYFIKENKPIFEQSYQYYHNNFYYAQRILRKAVRDLCDKKLFARMHCGKKIDVFRIRATKIVGDALKDFICAMEAVYQQLLLLDDRIDLFYKELLLIEIRVFKKNIPVLQAKMNDPMEYFKDGKKYYIIVGGSAVARYIRMKEAMG